MQLPWTHSCFVCGESNPRGFKLRSSFENGRVSLEYTTDPSDSGWRGVMHGGLTMTLLDEVMTWAAILNARKGCVAAEFTTRLKQPIRVGERVRVEGWVVSNRRRLMLVEGQVLSAEGDVLAVASGKYTPVADEVHDGFEKDFVSAPSVSMAPWDELKEV
jgi:acyl-coenzyme A thioesterase PaaI-like protein